MASKYYPIEIAGFYSSVEVGGPVSAFYMPIDTGGLYQTIDVPGLTSSSAVLNATAPVISGTAQELATLAVTAGEWTGGPTLTYQWRRDSAPVGGATSATYALALADVGSTIDVLEIPNGDSGSAVASNPIGPILYAVLHPRRVSAAHQQLRNASGILTDSGAGGVVPYAYDGDAGSDELLIDPVGEDGTAIAASDPVGALYLWDDVAGQGADDGGSARVGPTFTTRSTLDPENASAYLSADCAFEAGSIERVQAPVGAYTLWADYFIATVHADLFNVFGGGEGTGGASIYADTSESIRVLRYDAAGAFAANLAITAAPAKGEYYRTMIAYDGGSTVTTRTWRISNSTEVGGAFGTNNASVNAAMSGTLLAIGNRSATTDLRYYRNAKLYCRIYTGYMEADATVRNAVGSGSDMNPDPLNYPLIGGYGGLRSGVYRSSDPTELIYGTGAGSSVYASDGAT